MDTFALQLIGSAVALFIVYIWMNCKRASNFPPGPPCIPILGSIPFIGIGKYPLYVTYTELAKKYGEIMSVAIGNRWSVVLTGYDVIREALIDQATDFAGRASLEYRIKYYNPRQIGIGLCQYTDEFCHQRNLSMRLLRVLGYGSNNTEQRIKEECSFLLERFEHNQDAPFDPHLSISMAVCNVICYLCFGERYEYTDEKFLKLMKDLDDFLITIMKDADGDFIPLMRLRPGHRKTMRLFSGICKRLYNFIEIRVKERRECYEEDQEPLDFVQAYYLDQSTSTTGGRITEDWCAHIVTDFFIAGADTSSTTLTWMILYLIRYPRVQGKLHDDIKRVLSDRSVQLSDRMLLPYAEAVIMETLRYCSLSGLTFKATTKDTVFRGYHLPKGTEVIINTYQVNGDANLWGDPEVFRPERFIGPDGQIDRPEYWIAFGFGRRSCFGEQLARQELFLFLVSIVQKYQICNPNDRPLPDETPLGEELILKPRPFKIVAIPRS